MTHWRRRRGRSRGTGRTAYSWRQANRIAVWAVTPVARGPWPSTAVVGCVNFGRSHPNRQQRRAIRPGPSPTGGGERGRRRHGRRSSTPLSPSRSQRSRRKTGRGAGYCWVGSSACSCVLVESPPAGRGLSDRTQHGREGGMRQLGVGAVSFVSLRSAPASPSPE